MRIGALISHVFTVGQKFAIEFCGNNYLVTVGGISNDVMQLVEGDDEVDERTSSNNNKVNIREVCLRPRQR